MPSRSNASTRKQGRHGPVCCDYSIDERGTAFGGAGPFGIRVLDRTQSETKTTNVVAIAVVHRGRSRQGTVDNGQVIGIASNPIRVCGLGRVGRLWRETSLGQLLARLKRCGQQMPERAACFVANKVAGALDFAHQLCAPNGAPLGLVHCDVTPANILLSVDGDVRLTTS